MHLAVVGPTYPIKGGISHYTTLLVRALRRHHDVLFISYEYQYPEILYPGTSQTSQDESAITEQAEFLWHTLKPWTLNKIARRMREFEVDGVVLSWVTHFFGWHISQLEKLIHKSTDAPVILLCHNVKQHEDRPLEGPLTRMAFSGADAYIVHSEEDRTNLLKAFPNALVKKNFHPTYDIFAQASHWRRETSRAALGINDQAPMILYFGAVRPYKGLKWLIEAAPAIMATVTGCHIWCVGDFWDGPDEFENRAKSLGVLFDPNLPDRGGVHFVAEYIPNEEVGKYFTATDLVVLPYESATQSGIVQVAYGFSKPCLVTNVGGLPEVVLDGKTGYIVPPKDPDAIALKTSEFFAGGKMLRSQFASEIEQWRMVFDWEHMVETIEELLRELRITLKP
jgi:glycosyltransferase involved in cell wall biosynthesis